VGDDDEVERFGVDARRRQGIVRSFVSDVGRDRAVLDVAALLVPVIDSNCLTISAFVFPIGAPSALGSRDSEIRVGTRTGGM